MLKVELVARMICTLLKDLLQEQPGQTGSRGVFVNKHLCKLVKECRSGGAHGHVMGVSEVRS